MKKFGSWLFTIVTILCCCCLCCSCGEKAPTKDEKPTNNENSEEDSKNNLEKYYEIEYQDGSGVHVAKAIRLWKIKDITIMEKYREGNIYKYKEWEYSSLVRLSFNLGINDIVGTFHAHLSKNSADEDFGALWIYYDETANDYKYQSHVLIYDAGGDGIVPINDVSLENENIIISNQTLAKFSFSSVDGYSVIGLTENGSVYHQGLRIDFDYEPYYDREELITLLDEGDFTTIQRKDMSDITIRSENRSRRNY